jgi:hypothetical protein
MALIELNKNAIGDVAFWGLQRFSVPIGFVGEEFL